MIGLIVLISSTNP